jgi:hypothetical protein
MYSLPNVLLSNMTECSGALRRLRAGCTSMEEVTSQLLQYLYTHEKVLPLTTSLEEFKVDHVFPSFGKKVLVLNARCLE